METESIMILMVIALTLCFVAFILYIDYKQRQWEIENNGGV
jgi:cbb3-type cytochrome oxidase subunit 3